MKLDLISESEAARYMGVKGEPDNAVMELLDRAEKLVRENVSPKYVFIETSVTLCDDGVKLGCMDKPLVGNSIKKHLEGCDRVILFAATLSAVADKLIRQAVVENMAFSLAVDCICSAAVEQVCDKAEEEIFADKPNLYRTWRFSPGYGDLPIDIQGDILNALNAQRRIGLTVTESSLLVPTKSVTAIIGISSDPISKGEKGCAVCSRKDSCIYSKNNLKNCCHSV